MNKKSITVFMIACGIMWNYCLSFSQASSTNRQNNHTTSPNVSLANPEFLGLSGIRLYEIVLHPTDDNIIYVGTANSYIYKSINNGSSWTQIDSSNGLSDEFIYDVKMDPTNTNILYAATGSSLGTPHTEMLFKTYDDGNTWYQRNIGLSKFSIYSLIIDPYNPTTLYAGTHYYGGSVYKSTNGGDSWIEVNNGMGLEEVHCLSMHPTNSQIVFAGTKIGNIYKSTNGGTSWNLKSLPGNSGSSEYVFHIIFDPDNPSTMYAGTYHNGVYKSEDIGESWTQMNAGLSDSSIYALSIHPTGRLFVGTSASGIFTSQDDGQTWSHLNDNGTFSTVHYITFRNSASEILYISTHSGMYRMILDDIVETISTPTTPTGSASGKVGASLTYSTGGSTSNLGHSVEYRFDWGDDSGYSSWGSSSQSHSYTNVGTYSVKAQARCQTHTSIVSGWSTGKTVTVSGHTLTITTSGSGSVSKNPNKSQYNHNESVTLTASPSSGYQFDKWGGNLSGSTNPTTIIMDGDKSVIAYFKEIPETISTPSTPTGSASGKVGVSLAYSTGGSSSNLGHSVEYRFDWGDGSAYSSWGSSSQSHSYTNVGAYSVKAQARCQTHTSIESGWSLVKTVNISGHILNITISGSGSVSKDPNKSEYNHNESVILTAAPSLDYEFDHWEGDLSNDTNPTSITMDGDKNIAAHFTESDTTKPVIHQITLLDPDYGTNWYNQSQTSSITVRVEYSDDNASSAQLNISELQNPPANQNILQGQHQTTQFTIDISSAMDGQYNLIATVFNTQGANSTGNAQFQLDATAPTGYTSDAPATNNSSDYTVTITGAADGAGCGVGNTYLDVFTSDSGAPTTARTSMPGMTAVGTYYYRYYVADLMGNAGEVQSAATVVSPTVDVYIIILHPDNNSSWEVGSIQTITWQTVGSVSNVTIELSRDNGQQFEQLVENTDNDGSYDWKVTNPVSDKCLVRILNAATDQILGQTQQVFTIREQTVTSFVNPSQLPSGNAQTAYRLISVPGRLDDPLASSVLEDELGPYNPLNWRLFSYNQSNWIEFNDTLRFKPGKSYFLLVRNAVGNIDAGSGVYIGDVSFDIHLDAGWNLIANPFNMTLSADRLSLNAAELLVLYDYSGSWSISSVVHPWKGYAVYVSSPSILSVTPQWSGFTKTMAALPWIDTFAPAWFIRIIARCDQAYDDLNYVGVSENASDAKDNYDLPEPPPIGEYVSVCFPHADWRQAATNFTTDFRSHGQKGYVWDCVVETPISGMPLNLRFENTESVPMNYSIHLFNQHSSATTDLRTRWEVTIPPQSGVSQHRVRLLIGEHDFIAEQNVLPTRFQLSQNYPNPFNPKTMIQYQLAQAVHVTLTVYNLNGQMINTLVDQFQNAGFYTVYWDGILPGGEKASNGLYLYQLQAETYRETKKMILAR